MKIIIFETKVSGEEGGLPNIIKSTLMLLMECYHGTITTRTNNRITVQFCSKLEHCDKRAEMRKAV